tara:strand:+ start:8253 stop:10079 length:1827 start_codon:yes stop_codon:yes gene_type:complete
MAKESKDIKYINKDFDTFRNNLTQFSQTYFPTTYNDFSPNSPGSLFMEMASYVGDVLSFYLDNQIQETFLQYARQEPNLYELAYMMGYKPKVTSVALVDVEIYQTVPAKTVALTQVPDYDYALLISENSVVSSTLGSNITFLIEDSIDFTVSSSIDPTEVSIQTVTNGGQDVDTFLLKKTRKAKSSTISTLTQTFTEVERYPTITINDSNIVGILDIVDSDGGNWTEVPYLAQETVFKFIKSTDNLVPYKLNLTKVPRRFVSRFKSKTQLQIQFGASTDSSNVNEVITPNPDNIGIGLPFTQDKIFTAFDPQNFLFTNTYGIAPANTTLTIRYLTGGGVNANVESNLLNSLTGTIKFQKDNLINGTAQTVFDSLLVTNPKAASGGSDGDSVQEIRNNSLGNFGAQLRTVTPQDYLTRALSLPPDLGVVSKAHIESQKAENSSLNSSLLDLYVLAYNSEKQLINASSDLKRNLSTYLSQFRSATDSINIKDAFIVNIAIDFSVIILPNYNSNEVIFNCISSLQDYFNINNQQINQPILLKDISIMLDQIEGVQTVDTVEIRNKNGGNYSQFGYDIKGATQNNIIYPSIDPCIFEVKFPNTDIKGRVRTF